MSGDPMTPCPRCGVLRQVRQNGRAGKHCQDCKTLSGKASVSRNWMDDAACATVDPEVFFPEADSGWQPTREAKRICASCPVRDECAADTPAWDRHSIRAGLTATERRRKAAA